MDVVGPAVCAALALGLPPYLVWLWRALPPVWRGERRRPPLEGFRIFAISARSYLSGLLAVTAWCGGFAATGAAVLAYEMLGVDEGTPLDVALTVVLSVTGLLAAVLLAAAVPLTVLQWVVNAYNRPHRLVPPRYRGRPGSVGERARRYERGRSPVPQPERHSP